MATGRSRQLQELARRVAAALPLEVAEEVVLTGSVSRGVADEVSDIEMLIVTPEPLELRACFEHARAAGLESLDTWGAQGTPTQRVSGFREGVPLELIWWSREYAESSIDAIFLGDASSAADAIANGEPLRTSGLLSRWQARLADYPDGLAAGADRGGRADVGRLYACRVADARPPGRAARAHGADAGRRRARAADRLRGQPGLAADDKRLAARVAPLAVKPDRLAERIEAALSEPDPRRALLVMTELQAETAALAPDGPNVNRARRWLSAAAALLSSDDLSALEAPEAPRSCRPDR